MLTLTKPKKEPTLVELTEQEFLKVLFDTTDKLQRDIYDIEDQRSQFFKLYRNYCHEKQKYNIKFYLEDNKLFYKTFNRPSIGYKIRGIKDELKKEH